MGMKVFRSPAQRDLSGDTGLKLSFHGFFPCDWENNHYRVYLYIYIYVMCLRYLLLFLSCSIPTNLLAVVPAISRWWLRRQRLHQTVYQDRGVLTVTVKARCWLELFSSVSGQFPVNFHTQWLLWNAHVHVDCAGSHKGVLRGLGIGLPPQHVPIQHPHQHPHPHQHHQHPLTSSLTLYYIILTRHTLFQDSHTGVIFFPCPTMSC